MPTPVTQLRAGSTISLYRMPVEVRGGPVLTGTWPGQESPLLLAAVDDLG